MEQRDKNTSKSAEASVTLPEELDYILVKAELMLVVVKFRAAAAKFVAAAEPKYRKSLLLIIQEELNQELMR